MSLIITLSSDVLVMLGLLDLVPVKPPFTRLQDQRKIISKLLQIMELEEEELLTDGSNAMEVSGEKMLLHTSESNVIVKLNQDLNHTDVLKRVNGAEDAMV
jgi:hypothetical protein